MQGLILMGINEFSTTPICMFEKSLNEKFVALKVITGYSYDNRKLLVSNGLE